MVRASHIHFVLGLAEVRVCLAIARKAAAARDEVRIVSVSPSYALGGNPNGTTNWHGAVTVRGSGLQFQTKCATVWMARSPSMLIDSWWWLSVSGRCNECRGETARTSVGSSDCRHDGMDGEMPPRRSRCQPSSSDRPRVLPSCSVRSRGTRSASWLRRGR